MAFLALSRGEGALTSILTGVSLAANFLLDLLVDCLVALLLGVSVVLRVDFLAD